MDLWGILGQLVARVRSRRRRETAATYREVTAELFWSQQDDDQELYLARLLYTTDPYHANDLVFLSRLVHRMQTLWHRKPETRSEAKVLALMNRHFTDGQRLLVPQEYCGCEGVYLHDFEWPSEEVGPDFSPGDLNRGMRTLRLRTDNSEVLIEPCSPDDDTRRARRRVYLLRSRGAVPVTAEMVQANSDLFQPGPDNLPAVVLFSLSTGAIERGQFAKLARQLFEARDQPGSPIPSLADAVEMLRAGNTIGWRYHRRVRLPPISTGGDEVYLADLWIHRPFVKEGYLGTQTVRCLAESGEQGGIELLPWDAEEGSAVVLDPLWLTWNDGIIPRLAQAIDAERLFEDLPILADALEEAGCTNVDLLDHCRREGEHLCGCWVVDLLLGKG